MKFEFSETQRFTQWWLWVLLAGVGCIPIYGLYKQLILNEPFGDTPMSDMGLIVFALFVFGIIGLFLLMHIQTSINEGGIEVSFVPFFKKKFNWVDIEDIQLIEHGLLSSGIRVSLQYGTVYNVKGKHGLLITSKKGNKFMIGTQKHEKLAAELDLMKKQLDNQSQ